METNILPVSESLRVYEDILQTIGHTPLVHLARIGKGLPCPLYAKVESFNPGGSVKDRIGLNMIEEAERSGRLKAGGTVVESTSGNTGVGLAIVCALKGYRAVFVMPDKMSNEKIQLLRAYGARVVITPTAVEPDDPRSYYNVAKRIVAETPNAILANQYHNPENPLSHYHSTGPEIWEQTQGRVTDVVIGMGTGGTISGVGRYLKEQNPKICVVGVDPEGSILMETWQQGHIPDDVRPKTYKVEGIGEDFLPSTLDLSMIDEIIRVGDRESFLWTRRLVKEEGIFCGGSSGTAVAGAVRYARSLSPDRLVVVILPDSGSRYLSKIFNDDWMRENGFLQPEWNKATLGEVLATKPEQGLITACVDDPMGSVINLLKEHDISQAPVLNTDGSLAGMITEVELLKHVLDTGHNHSPDEPIGGILRIPGAIFPIYTPLSDVLSRLVDGQVVLVTEDEKPVGILTKIDVLDFISRGQ
jgi:cystathionine beta-synthase